MSYMKHATFTGRLVIVGFGSIGQGVLPLILKHLEADPAKITIVTAEERGHGVAREYGVRFVLKRLTTTNYKDVLSPMLGEGDFLVNVSVDVSSLALVELCQSKGAFYIDTCIEPWAGGYTDTSLSPSLRSNYALREAALKMKGEGPTAVMTHGANPGLVSHLTKKALLTIAADAGLKVAKPTDRAGWAKLMQTLGVKVVHVAERDTQTTAKPKQPGEFVNTWSVEGFVGEGLQPAELGWGSHEKELPRGGHHHEFGRDCAIYISRPGASVRVRSWTPMEGAYQGFLITHSEAISLADYFTVGEGQNPEFRPTVHYSYHPCDEAVLSLHELAGKGWHFSQKAVVAMEEIAAGNDELGVLLMGHSQGAYWFGSRLSIGEARRRAPHNNATSLQVTSTVLAGMIWALENPRRGVVEPEEMDFERILELATPYLGTLVGEYSDWTPLEHRGELFEEDLDREDPWQFKNFLVI
jgi:homospermidine synthase